jgi:hypothetical protein
MIFLSKPEVVIQLKAQNKTYSVVNILMSSLTKSGALKT